MQLINTSEAPGAIGPYVQGYVVNGFVFTSGQIPVNPADGTVPEGISAQAEQSCKNVAAVLKAGGSDIGKVIKTTCFLADMGDFAAFNEVYARDDTDRSCKRNRYISSAGLKDRKKRHRIGQARQLTAVIPAV